MRSSLSSQPVSLLKFIALLATILIFAGANLPRNSTLASMAPGVHFKDVRESSGITFRQDATATDEKYYLETMGIGVAWIDYDQDGLEDLYFIQSAATDIYTPPQPLRSALYHNNGDGTFTDVTTKAGLAGEGH